MYQLMPRSVFCWLWQKVQVTVAGIVLLKESVLYELRVTSQEYVVLFSKNACDMYARGICDKYYHGEWKEEQYGDAFE